MVVRDDAPRSASRAELMEQRYRVPIIVATLLVIPVMILESVDVGQPWQTGGQIGNWIIWLTFLAETVAMLAVVPDRWEWVKRNPLDVMIVVLTPPVTPAVLQSVRVLRILRLVRLFRVAVLIRGAFTVEGLRYAAFLAFLTLIAGAQAFASIEGKSISDGLYWAIGTMTSAGSGDVIAKEGETEVVGSVLMVVGLAFAAILTGALAQRFIVTEDTVTRGNIEASQKLDATNQRLDGLEARLAEMADTLAEGRHGPNS